MGELLDPQRHIRIAIAGECQRQLSAPTESGSLSLASEASFDVEIGTKRVIGHYDAGVRQIWGAASVNDDLVASLLTKAGIAFAQDVRSRTVYVHSDAARVQRGQPGLSSRTRNCGELAAGDRRL